MQPQQAAHLIIGFHLGDLLFDQLMVRDLGAERLALVRVSNRRITRSANYSRGAGGDSKSSLLERKHRDLETFAFFADEVCFRNAHVLQRKISGVAGANSHLPVNAP